MIPNAPSQITYHLRFSITILQTASHGQSQKAPFLHGNLSAHCRQKHGSHCFHSSETIRLTSSRRGISATVSTLHHPRATPPSIYEYISVFHLQTPRLPSYDICTKRTKIWNVLASKAGVPSHTKTFVAEYSKDPCWKRYKSKFRRPGDSIGLEGYEVIQQGERSSSNVWATIIWHLRSGPVHGLIHNSHFRRVRSVQRSPATIETRGSQRLGESVSERQQRVVWEEKLLGVITHGSGEHSI